MLNYANLRNLLAVKKNQNNNLNVFNLKLQCSILITRFYEKQLCVNR